MQTKKRRILVNCAMVTQYHMMRHYCKKKVVVSDSHTVSYVCLLYTSDAADES